MRDLIVDEREERRNDDGDSAGLSSDDLGRELVAERLSSSCGHENEDVLSGESSVDGFELIRTVRLETELFFEEFESVGRPWMFETRVGFGRSGFGRTRRGGESRGTVRLLV